VDEIMDDLARVLNQVLGHFCRSETAYRHASVVHDADSLLHYLKAGAKREELRSQKLEDGIWAEEDWNDD
jgi:hypothetical protein